MLYISTFLEKNTKKEPGKEIEFTSRSFFRILLENESGKSGKFLKNCMQKSNHR